MYVDLLALYSILKYNFIVSEIILILCNVALMILYVFVQCIIMEHMWYVLKVPGILDQKISLNGVMFLIRNCACVMVKLIVKSDMIFFYSGHCFHLSSLRTKQSVMKTNLLVIVIFFSSSCSLWDQGEPNLPYVDRGNNIVPFTLQDWHSAKPVTNALELQFLV